MPTVSDQIITDITDHVRRFGGDFTACCVGTAREWHNPIFDSRQSGDKDDDLICREAYTPAAGRAARLFCRSGRTADSSLRAECALRSEWQPLWVGEKSVHAAGFGLPPGRRRYCGTINPRLTA
jgi:hypothetical protein